MFGLGSFGFANPWLLTALLLLPLIWWLLRITPPAPREVLFPAIRLLFGLN
ncbi:MAG: BatA domain-containing protein, partial [Pseudomonadota bacterium]|nr:BatA domain-containing protein [Pseudomonadota bacterium]